MSEEQQRRSRVVVETPTARREVVQTQVERVPERRGVSTGVVALVAITAIAMTAMIVWYLMQPKDDASTNTNVRVATTAPTPVQPVIVQQPTPIVQQPPVIVQPPVTTTQPAPIVVPPATTTTTSSPSANATDDGTVQLNVDKKISEDTTLAPLGITATVVGGKVTLIGTVDSPELKRRAERAVRAVKGVKSVDNQITVAGGTSAPGQ